MSQGGLELALFTLILLLVFNYTPQLKETHEGLSQELCHSSSSLRSLLDCHTLPHFQSPFLSPPAQSELIEF